MPPPQPWPLEGLQHRLAHCRSRLVRPERGITAQSEPLLSCRSTCTWSQARCCRCNPGQAVLPGPLGPPVAAKKWYGTPLAVNCRALGWISQRDTGYVSRTHSSHWPREQPRVEPWPVLPGTNKGCVDASRVIHGPGFSGGGYTHGAGTGLRKVLVGSGSVSRYRVSLSLWRSLLLCLCVTMVQTPGSRAKSCARGCDGSCMIEASCRQCTGRNGPARRSALRRPNPVRSVQEERARNERVGGIHLTGTRGAKTHV